MPDPTQDKVCQQAGNCPYEKVREEAARWREEGMLRHLTVGDFYQFINFVMEAEDD